MTGNDKMATFCKQRGFPARKGFDGRVGQLARNAGRKRRRQREKAKMVKL